METEEAPCVKVSNKQILWMQQSGIYNEIILMKFYLSQ